MKNDESLPQMLDLPLKMLDLLLNMMGFILKMMELAALRRA